MKKLLCLLTTLLIGLLPLCSAAGEGWIADADLSDEEQNLLQLFRLDESYGPYEFKAPDGANYITLICWELEDGQWIELMRVPRELTPSIEENKLIITAVQNTDGRWDTSIHQSQSAEDIPDGRICVTTEDVVNGMWISIQQDKHLIPLSAGIYQDNTFTSRGWRKEEAVNSFGLHWMQRCFINPESNRIQQRIPAPLNETVPLEIYVCYFEGHHPLPPISAYHDPAAFAAFDYAYAVTAIFTAEPLPEGE